VKATGDIITVAGTYDRPRLRGQRRTRLLAKFNDLRGLATDSLGNLYIATPTTTRSARSPSRQVVITPAPRSRLQPLLDVRPARHVHRGREPRDPGSRDTLDKPAVQNVHAGIMS